MSKVFVDRAAQAYIYLIIYVCVGTSEADARGHTCNPLKTWDPFRSFFEILGISLEIFGISNSKCDKPIILKFLIRNTKYFNRNSRFSIEILGITYFD